MNVSHDQLNFVVNNICLVMEFRAQASESVKDVAFVLGTLNLVEKVVVFLNTLV